MLRVPVAGVANTRSGGRVKGDAELSVVNVVTERNRTGGRGEANEPCKYERDTAAGIAGAPATVTGTFVATNIAERVGCRRTAGDRSTTNSDRLSGIAVVSDAGEVGTGCATGASSPKSTVEALATASEREGCQWPRRIERVRVDIRRKMRRSSMGNREAAEPNPDGHAVRVPRKDIWRSKIEEVFAAIGIALPPGAVP